MTSDEQLMLDFQKGSCEAFTELFHRYREAIYGFFRRRLDDAARAEELAQDTFLAVLRGITRYEPRALVRTYLYGIAFNLLNADRRKRTHEENHSQAQAKAAEPPAGPDPESALWVRQALERLEAEAREILMLREYEQLSYAEIASLLRVPVNTVRSRLFRARMELKEMLAPNRDTLEDGGLQRAQ